MQIKRLNCLASASQNQYTLGKNHFRSVLSQESPVVRVAKVTRVTRVIKVIGVVRVSRVFDVGTVVTVLKVIRVKIQHLKRICPNV